MIKRGLVTLYVFTVVGVLAGAYFYRNETAEALRSASYSKEAQGDFSSAISVATDHKAGVFFRGCLVTYMSRPAFQVDIKQPDTLDRIWVDAETFEIMQIEPLRFESMMTNLFRSSLADAVHQSGDVADKLRVFELQAQGVISGVEPFMVDRRLQYKIVMVSKAQNILEFTYDPLTGARSIGGYRLGGD